MSAALWEEATSFAAGSVPSTDSNIFYNNTATGGLVIELMDGVQAGYLSPNQPFTTIDYNVVANTNTASLPIGTCCSGANAWYVGTAAAHDRILLNTPPVLVDRGRSLPFFMDYLDQAGLLTKTS